MRKTTILVNTTLLDASTHLYMRVCPSVGPSVVHPWSVRPSRAFFRIAEIDKKQHRIIGKVELLFLHCNNLQKILKQLLLLFLHRPKGVVRADRPFDQGCYILMGHSRLRGAAVLNRSFFLTFIYNVCLFSSFSFSFSF